MVEKFSDGKPTVVADDHDLCLSVGDNTHDLSRDEAVQLRDALSAALTRTTEYVHTSGTHREDGKYVVARRSANSAGHEKVFESFEHCERLYDRLPDSFDASDVERSGLTGGRRHMLVWHYAEHPAFDCELASRQPLTVEKTTVEADAASEDAAIDANESVDATTEAAASTDEAVDRKPFGVMSADD